MNTGEEMNKEIHRKTSEEICSQVSRRIKEERRSQKLTLRKLSELADISVSFLGDIEKGRSNPSLPRLVEIAQALGKSAAYFLEEEKSQGPDEAAEKLKPFGSLGEDHRKLLMRLTKEPGFLKIIEAFEGFENWTEGERAEILSLLRTKQEYK